MRDGAGSPWPRTRTKARCRPPAPEQNTFTPESRAAGPSASSSAGSPSPGAGSAPQTPSRSRPARTPASSASASPGSTCTRRRSTALKWPSSSRPSETSARGDGADQPELGGGRDRRDGGRGDPGVRQGGPGRVGEGAVRAPVVLGGEAGGAGQRRGHRVGTRASASRLPLLRRRRPGAGPRERPRLQARGPDERVQPFDQPDRLPRSPRAAHRVRARRAPGSPRPHARRRRHGPRAHRHPRRSSPRCPRSSASARGRGLRRPPRCPLRARPTACASVSGRFRARPGPRGRDRCPARSPHG